ncbi:MAG: oligosaccharide flippase family protein, partial [Ferruginibacter sp.]
MAGHRKRLAGNFISLSVVQGLSIIFPLITFPYLLRILGVEGFGVFTLIQTFIIYFDMLVSFGFGLTATQRISKDISDSAEVYRVISAVYIIKFILFVFSVIVFFACCLFIPYLRENILIVLVSSLYLLGNLLFPDWYFQGIQKMRNITIVAFISKIISLSLIILLVKKPTDIVYAVLAMCAGNFVAGLIGFIILKTSISFKLIVPARDYMLSFFKESGYVFTSIILAPLYASVNLFILQIFTNPLMVGYYAIAEKIFSAIGMLTSIANRTFYPHLSQLYVKSIEAYKKNIRSILTLFFFGFCLLALFQFFGAEFIVRIIAGKKRSDDVSYAVDILRIMSIGLLFSPYVSFFFQMLILQGQRKAAMQNILATVIINI